VGVFRLMNSSMCPSGQPVALLSPKIEIENAIKKIYKKNMEHVTFIYKHMIVGRR